MSWDAEAFTKTLRQAVEAFDKQGAAALCEGLLAHLFNSADPYSAKEAERILQILRNKRMFILMQQVGDALIQTRRHTVKIRRQYAQALLDQGNLTAAIAILNELIADTGNAPAADVAAAQEHVEGRGLLGRAYKQLYVNAANPTNQRNRQYLEQAIFAYLGIYTAAPQTHLWHGINVVALLRRAERDGIAMVGLADAATLAQAILQEIEERHADQRADMWDYATAAEACIALDKPDQALEWIARYIRVAYADAFEIASTLRQFTEVWQLDMHSEVGKQILPILRAELLRREGGRVDMDIGELLLQKQAEASTTAKFEKVFGDDSFQTYKWYMTGADRCLAVARLSRDATKGFGTGFLLNGAALHDNLGDDPVLITNAHVLSDDPEVKGALRSDEAIIIFEALGADEFKVGKILWSSPPAELDATIVEFDKEDMQKLREMMKRIKLYPVAKVLPLVDDTQRVYVIGHPSGGTLSLSFQDNKLLDHEAPRIHYRTPTEGGSSGSPVFNRQWQLIGLHHAGDAEMPRLNGKLGTYAANEGIWIRAIVNALAKVF